MNNVKPRVAMLIDEVNIYLTAQRLFGNAKINIEAMLQRLRHTELVRVIAYCVETPENDISIFRKKVTRLGVEVKSKPLKIFRDGTRKGDWDVGMAVDAVQLADKVDDIILVTGDGDFESLVHYLQGHGVNVKVMAFQKRVSHELLRSIDEFIPITDDLLLKKKN